MDFRTESVQAFAQVATNFFPPLVCMYLLCLDQFGVSLAEADAIWEGCSLELLYSIIQCVQCMHYYAVAMLLLVYVDVESI